MADIGNEFDGVWAGLSTMLVAVLAVGALVLTTDQVNIGGVIAGLALALVSLVQVLSPRVSPWFERLNHRWVGLFWIFVGIGIAGLGLAASSTIGKLGSGLIIGALCVLYGCLTVLGR